MGVHWSDFALQSLEEIIMYYESVGGLPLADRVESEIWNQVEESNRFPYVAFLREPETDLREVVDVVHTSRKLPKGSATEGDDS